MGFKDKMMDELMEKFFKGMSEEEKNNMMQGMMEGEGAGMMGMMKNMMSRMMSGKTKTKSSEKGEGFMNFNPMEMCIKMMSKMEKSSDLAAYATPEVRALFEEWAEQIENEILDFIRANNNPAPDKIAEHFKLSKNSVNFFLTKLSQKGKINIKAEAE
jgi:hypothetical protein